MPPPNVCLTPRRWQTGISGSLCRYTCTQGGHCLPPDEIQTSTYLTLIYLTRINNRNKKYPFRLFPTIITLRVWLTVRHFAYFFSHARKKLASLPISYWLVYRGALVIYKWNSISAPSIASGDNQAEGSPGSTRRNCLFYQLIISFESDPRKEKKRKTLGMCLLYPLVLFSSSSRPSLPLYVKPIYV